MTLSRCIAIALMAFAPQCLAAGFDCTLAKTPVERAICKDEMLSELDEELAIAYRAALKESASPEEMKASQRSWLTTLNRCNDDRTCLQRAYEGRLDELSHVDDDSEGGALIVTCDGATETMTIQRSGLSGEDKPSVDGGSLRLERADVSTFSVSGSELYRECLFQSGRTVRVKVGGEEFWPYGECGADPWNIREYLAQSGQDCVTSERTRNVPRVFADQGRVIQSRAEVVR